MKTRYKYIHFDKNGDDTWTCLTNRGDTELGNIMKNLQWKCYEFVPEYGMAFTEDCCSDISHFLRQLDWRNEK